MADLAGGTIKAMIAIVLLHVSAAFEKKFRCPVSFADERPEQTGGMDAWSCHFFRIGRREVVMAMHDASLFTLILPTAGMKGFDGFLMRLIERIAEEWTRYDLPFDPDNQTVMVVRRSDKSRIGSMNDAINLIRFYHERARDNGTDLNLSDMERRSNETPYKTLGYNNPMEKLRSLGESG